MKKFISTLFISTLLSFFAPTASLCKAKIDSASLAKLNAECISLKDSINKQAKEIDLLSQEKKTLDSLTSKATIDSLRADTARIKHDIDSIRGEITKYQEENDSIKREQEKIKSSVAGLKRSLSPEIITNILKKSFSATTDADIETLKDATINKDEKEKAKLFRKMYDIIQDANKAITEEFDSCKIASMRHVIWKNWDDKNIKNFNNKKLEEEQCKEIDSIDIKLSRYEQGIKYIRNIIKDGKKEWGRKEKKDYLIVPFIKEKYDTWEKIKNNKEEVEKLKKELKTKCK